MHEDVFLEMFSESNNFIIDLFLADFQQFQNTQMKHFLGGNLHLLKSEIQDYRAVALEKRDSLVKIFLELLKF